MNTNTPSTTFTLEPEDHKRLSILCGELNSHIKQIEARLKLSIHQRGNHFNVIGEDAEKAEKVLINLYNLTRNGGDIFLGGFSVALTDSLTFTYTTTMGDFGFDFTAGGVPVAG